jgi:hypothetical protein
LRIALLANWANAMLDSQKPLKNGEAGRRIDVPEFEGLAPHSVATGNW